MATARYKLNEEGGVKEFDTPEELVLEVFLNDKYRSNEFKVTTPAGIELICNIQNGKVIHDDSKTPKGVHNDFENKEIVYTIFNPVSNAIGLAAKVELLNQLSALGNDRITQIIQKNHADSKNKKCISNLTDRGMEETIREIHRGQQVSILSTLSFLKPKSGSETIKPSVVRKSELIHKAVTEVVTMVEFRRIKSMDDVSKVMNKVQARIATPKLSKSMP